MASAAGTFALLHAALAHAADTKIITTDVPPFAYIDNGRLTGVCVDVVQEIERRLNVTAPIDVEPWLRAFHAGQEQPRTILVCPKRTADRETLFKWVGPIVTTTADLYALTARHIQVTSLEDARMLTSILVPRGSYGAKFLADNGFTNVEEVDNPHAMFRMLLAGRAPAIFIENAQISALMTEQSIPSNTVRRLLLVLTMDADLTFSKDFPDADVAQWQKALDDMKQDGTYARIFKHYFPR